MYVRFEIGQVVSNLRVSFKEIVVKRLGRVGVDKRGDGAWAMGRAACAVVLLGACLALTGCAEETEGSVSGKVTYQGQPVTEGTVNFYSTETGIAAQANLDSSGAFRFEVPLPLGAYKVYFQPPSPPQLPPGSPPPPKVDFRVPMKYQDATQTPLTEEVKAGVNEFSFDLS